MAAAERGEGVLMCSVCDVPLPYGDFNINQHFNGATHRQNKAEYDRRMELGRSLPPPLNPLARNQTAVQVSGCGLPDLGSFSNLHGPNSLPGQLASFPAHQPTSVQIGTAASDHSAPQEEESTHSASPNSPDQLKFELVYGKRNEAGSGQCQICDQSFQSAEEAVRHLQSSQHQKFEQDVKKSECDVCRVKYSGPVSAKQHLKSEGHKRKVMCHQLEAASAQQGPETAASTNASEYRNLTSQTMTSSQFSHHMSNVNEFEETFRKALHVGDSSVNSVNSPGFSGSQPGVVQNVFNKDSPSPMAMTQINIPPSELFGQYQTPNVTQINIPPSEVLAQYQTPPVQQPLQPAPASPSAAFSTPEYVFDGSRGMCHVCNIQFTSRAHADSHLAGSKHQKARFRWQASNSSSSGTSDAQAGRQDAGYNFGMTSPQIYSDTAGVRGNPAPSHRMIRFDGNRGRCFACNVDLTSEAHANQHLSGKKHQTAAERWTAEGEVGSHPLYCDVCHKPFTGQESAAQHFSSEKHKKKVALSQGEAEAQKDPATGALLILRDGQLWYMCGVCKCPLNTPEQFRLHVNSPRHQTEAEKAKKQTDSNRSSPIDVNYIPLAQTPFSAEANAQTVMDPSDRDLLVAKPIVKTTPGTYIPQTPLFRTPHTGAANYPLASDSPFHAIVKTEPGTSSAHSDNTGLANNGSGHTGLHSNNLTTSGQRPSGHPTSSSLNGSSLQEDGSSSSGFGQNRGQSQSRPNFAGASASDLSGLSVGRLNRGGGGSQGTRTPGQVLRLDGDYEYDDDSPQLPHSSSSSDYKDQDRVGNLDEDRESTGDFSSVSGGDALSQTSDERRLASTASTTSDNLSLPHYQPGSLREDLAQRAQLRNAPPTAESNPFKGFRYNCQLCKQPMNTREDYDRHMKGLKHQMKAATVRAPDRRRETLVKREAGIEKEEAYKSCKTTPRTYQVELMSKTMDFNSAVVYLPTGTGKTLAAMMTISRMLTLNPRRPVLFLVDKVLLVLQQARYIINELGEPRTFNRPHLSEEGKMEERPLKVAVLCGGLSVRDGTPLWKHDVIVTTAAFCQNLLQDEVLRWANFSLVVFDEAHHCIKNHPYNRLLSEHHLTLAPEQQPKVLGLTASPAGRRTKEETLAMLKDLLQNLGGAQIATVEDPLAKQTLDLFSSSARLVPVCVPMTEAEMGFHETLLSYFISAYVELMRCSNLQQMSCPALQELMRSQPPVPDMVKAFAQHLMSEPDELSDMVGLAQTARIKTNTVDPNKFENIRMHVMSVGMTLLNSEDGIDFVLEDLERLFNPNLNKFFSELLQLGLPCRSVATYVQTLSDSAKLRNSQEEGEGGRSTMSIFQELLVTLSNGYYIDWHSSQSMALVLVRERKVAHKFKDQLKRTSFVRQQGMKVTVVVGHGASGGEGEGMNLRKQDKVLQGIKAHRYHIVVATSVAEEGVDIPECQLVVCLNPPTTVKALVQMRGRARKKDSYFVVLCSSQREKEKLEDLQRQEENMKWAAAQLAQHNDTEETKVKKKSTPGSQEMSPWQ